jgi:hypothetical protein
LLEECLPMSKAMDQDLPLKLRLRRLFFSQGYWSPIEVELSHYENLGVDAAIKRRSLTDLDVLGIKFNTLFTPHRVVADCKSGKNVSDANRLFWLRGVMDYFGADQAYFVRSKRDVHIRAIAPKMGLRALNAAELAGIEKNLGVEAFPVPLADPATYQAISELWGVKVPAKSKITDDQLRLKKVYSYLSYTYWYIESHRNLLTLIERYESIADLLDPADERHVLLAYTGAERFAYSLLDVAQHVVSMGAADVLQYARMYLYGGPLGLKDKERFFGLLRKATGYDEPLDPPWLRDVLELLGRLIRNPSGATDILRYIELIYIWCVRLGNTDVPELPAEGKNTAALVLAKDVVTGFVKASGLSEGLFTAVKSL